MVAAGARVTLPSILGAVGTDPGTDPPRLETKPPTPRLPGEGKVGVVARVVVAVVGRPTGVEAGVTEDVFGVRLREVTGPWGLLGGSWDRAPYSIY